MSYTRKVKLQDNERLAKINTETGEFKEVQNNFDNIPEDKILFNQRTRFYKTYEKVDRFLLDSLTASEYRAISYMKLHSKMNTNSLEPLTDNSSLSEISKYLNVHRNRIKPILDKLSNLGVYATYEVTNQYGKRIKGWILNPYISFKGKLISNEIIGLFHDTIIGSIGRS